MGILEVDFKKSIYKALAPDQQRSKGWRRYFSKDPVIKVFKEALQAENMEFGREGGYGLTAWRHFFGQYGYAPQNLADVLEQGIPFKSFPKIKISFLPASFDSQQRNNGKNHGLCDLELEGELKKGFFHRLRLHVQMRAFFDSKLNIKPTAKIVQFTLQKMSGGKPPFLGESLAPGAFEQCVENFGKFLRSWDIKKIVIPLEKVKDFHVSRETLEKCGFQETSEGWIKSLQ